jgi:hypothetical protein
MSDIVQSNATPLGRWLLRLALVCGLAAVLFVIGWLAEYWTSSVSESNNETIASQWSNTISQLGLDPIYPPQEDISVGDIFLTITKDATPLTTSLGRSIKIWHVDLSKELKETYNQTYIFPDTAPKPKSDGEFWPQRASTKSVFDASADRHELALVVLPGFTVARVHQASFTGGWLSKSFRSLFAIQGQGEKTIELKIPFAETYGVPAITANGYLIQFCEDNRFHNVCTEKGARGFLSTIVGDLAFQKLPAKPGEDARYQLTAEILIVSRVFLTRSIETVITGNIEFGAQGKLAAQLQDALQQLQTEAPKRPDQAPTSEEAAALRRALDEQKVRLNAAIAEAAGSPSGANGSIQPIDSNRITLAQVLQRPVVIAFRGIRNELSNER